MTLLRDLVAYLIDFFVCSPLVLLTSLLDSTEDRLSPSGGEWLHLTSLNFLNFLLLQVRHCSDPYVIG